jgi:hypothetical protein
MFSILKGLGHFFPSGFSLNRARREPTVCQAAGTGVYRGSLLIPALARLQAGGRETHPLGVLTGACQSRAVTAEGRQGSAAPLRTGFPSRTRASTILAVFRLMRRAVLHKSFPRAGSVGGERRRGRRAPGGEIPRHEEGLPPYRGGADLPRGRRGLGGQTISTPPWPGSGKRAAAPAVVRGAGTWPKGGLSRRGAEPVPGCGSADSHTRIRRTGPRKVSKSAGVTETCQRP